MQQPPKPSLVERFRRLPRNQKIVFWVIMAALFICSCGSFNALIKGPTSSTQSIQATTQQQPKQNQVAAPTPTPTRALTVEERIKKVATDSKQDAQVLWVPDTKLVQVSTYIGPQWNNDTYRDSIKMDCFDLQKAFWTAQPSLEIESVVVFLHGDTIDQYGKERREQVGACTLKRETAAKFQWQNLTWRTAWPVYDHTALAPFLQE